MKRATQHAARKRNAASEKGHDRWVVRVCASAVAALAILNAAAPVRAQCDGVWTKRMPAASPSARSNHQLAYDSARGVTVLFGGGFGDSTSGMNNETWEWNGTSWSQWSPATSPSPRTFFGMAYDIARGVTVLFGGYDDATNAPSGQTWEWDGTNWSQKSPVPAPSARFGHAMAYDSTRNVTVLFGGYDGVNTLAETWEWDGTSWVQRTPGMSPSPRTGLAMAYDGVRGATVLFGGNLNAETWEWNGTTWTQKFPSTSPAARLFLAMAYDSGSGATVLFGGTTGSGLVVDTWKWDGTNWFQQSTTTAPTGRYYHAMAYDINRSAVVLFGGVSNDTGVATNTNETWEWSVPTFQISLQPAAQIVGVGQAAILSVTATGPGPFSYQWRLNGNPLADGDGISGSATDTLIINPASTANNGFYGCQVNTLTCQTILSDFVELTIDPCKAVGTTGDADGNGILDSCETPTCGACGAGMATMMPMLLVGMIGLRRTRTVFRK
ncbi:MAG: immunoglobulin domain-containing protein [Planctomycetes bacterium]|nr:immunoglobulin domain-containing protein [Planctomycetota bacterium]